jgi:hypothetical protein
MRCVLACSQGTPDDRDGTAGVADVSVNDLHGSSSMIFDGWRSVVEHALAIVREVGLI